MRTFFFIRLPEPEGPFDSIPSLINIFLGRYLLLSSICNHLRYPNSHTNYFSNVLLFLFLEAPQEVIQDQITRVLLERLIANRPHPYGVLITFIELIRNPKYDFWSHTSFIRCAKEVEGVFQNVARSVNSST